MGCCVDYSEAKAQIETIVESFHPDDYKIFVARRESDGMDIVRKLGVVVSPNDEVNDAMYKEFVSLQASSNTSCIKVLYSQVDIRDGRLIDLFLFEITTEN